MVEIYPQNGRHRRQVIFQEDEREFHDAWQRLELEHDTSDYMYISSQESERPLWLHSFKHRDTRQYVTISSPRAS